MSWPEWAQHRNDKARAKARWRELREVDALGVRGITGDGREVVLFAGNDYLGLSAHPAVRTASHQALDRWGAGAGASRLTSGNRPVHRELEERLALWKGTEAALVFPSGYMANVGALSALAVPGVQICSDEMNHASIVDGSRLASALGARVEVYRHLDVGAVERLLQAWDGRALVVSDTIFSMDGDAAPVAELAEVCARRDAMLMLDEAHAVLGPCFKELPCEVLRIGTLSKTLGSQGGFIACSRQMADFLVNRCRSFIYSTGLAPASGAAALAALEVLESTEGRSLLGALENWCKRVGPAREVPSPIVPVLTGTEHAALTAADALLEMGLFVPAIRPPTVPPGTSRLRVSLSAAHTDNDVALLEKGLSQLGLSSSGQLPGC